MDCRIERKRHAMPAPVSARLHLPSSALAGCIHMAVERDTRGLQLDHAQRFNFYPASPLPSIAWIFEGELCMVQDHGPAQPLAFSGPLPRIAFAGPFRKPSASWSPGAVHALQAGFYPEALARLWGIRAEDYLNAIHPVEAVLPQEVCDALALVGTGDAPLLHQVESALQPFWRGAHGGKRALDLRGWFASLATRAAWTRTGAGLRQVQRKIKDLTGQSRRDLQLYARIEEAFVRKGSRERELAAVAVEAGYSDQSHLGREVKRVTGLSPKQFGERMKSDEAFWFYRLLDGYLHEAVD